MRNKSDGTWHDHKIVKEMKKAKKDRKRRQMEMLCTNDNDFMNCDECPDKDFCPILNGEK